MDAGAGFPAIGFIVTYAFSMSWPIPAISDPDGQMSFHLHTRAAQANIWVIVAFATALRGGGFA
jgi:hypothetical protein